MIRSINYLLASFLFGLCICALTACDSTKVVIDPEAAISLENDAQAIGAAYLALYTQGIKEPSIGPDDPVTPVGPITPANCSNCATSDWPGWLGDGQPRKPCPVCNADGKIKPVPRKAKSTSTYWKPTKIVSTQARSVFCFLTY